MKKTLSTLSMLLCILTGSLLTHGYAKGEIDHKTFFTDMLNVMEQHSLYRKDVNWEAIRGEVTGQVSKISNDSQFKALIYRTLQLINTNHSFVRFSNTGEVVFYADQHCKKPGYQTLNDVPPSIGYIYVSEHQSAGYQGNVKYANRLLDQIIEQDKEKLTAWVIDLSSNVGGNMYPMLAGLGPFFDNGVLGYFLSQNTAEDSQYSFRDGDVLLDGKLVMRLKHYRLRNQDIPVYVVIGGSTSSSGEAVAIALKALDNTTFIGEKTCGRATGNQRFPLSAGYELFLTTTFMADVNKQTYLNGISPEKPLSKQQILALLTKLSLETANK